MSTRRAQGIVLQRITGDDSQAVHSWCSTRDSEMFSILEDEWDAEPRP